MGKDKAGRLAEAAKFSLDHGGSQLTSIGLFAAAIAALPSEESNERNKHMTTIPESLPTLSSGSHSEGEGQACAMEYISILAGEHFSDHPACTDPVLASATRAVNDWMTDEGRHMLIPLIGRLFGTAERGSNEISCQLAEFIYSYVHAAIENGDFDGESDKRLVDYLTAVIDKFDELTGFNYEKDGRKLSDIDYKLMADAVAR